MTRKSRRKFSGEFKATVAIEALRERQTIDDLCRKYELHPSQINTWKKEAAEKLQLIFGSEKQEKTADINVEKLYAKIGQLEMGNDFLKKNLL